MAGKLLVFLTLAQFALSQKATPDGVRGGGAVFSKCGGKLFGGNDRCYEVKVTKLQVQMGADGTNDDVKAKICSDDKKTCCETPALKSSFADDWSKNDLETWTKKHFGDCKDKKFKIKKGLEVILSKKGTDTLGVTSLFVEAETVAKDKSIEPERFECGRYTIGGKADVKNSSSTQSKFCKTSPYVYERVKQINVTIGADGTDDNVKVEICSDVNDVCCKTKLSSLLSDDWSKNSVEVWKEKNLGDCKLVQYKINKANPSGGLRFALSKDGKDDLIVNKITVETEGIYGAKYKYDCGDFKLQSQGIKCVPGVNCIQKKNCKKSVVGAKTTLGFSRPKSKTTRRTTTKRPPPARVPISRVPASRQSSTARPPFRSGSGK